MNELKFQAEICKSLVAQGGYAQKIASRFQVGVPDLLLAHRDFEATLVECKWLGDKKTGNFEIVPALTAPQVNHLKKMVAVRGPVSVAVAVGWSSVRRHYFVLLAPGETCNPAYTAFHERVGGVYNVRDAINHYRWRQEKANV